MNKLKLLLCILSSLLLVLSCVNVNCKKMPIEKVKEAHVKELMKIKSVEGIGIGNVNGKKCIVIHLKDYSEIEKIPHELDGYPVKWNVIREIKAQ